MQFKKMILKNLIKTKKIKKMIKMIKIQKLMKNQMIKMKNHKIKIAIKLMLKIKKRNLIKMIK